MATLRQSKKLDNFTRRYLYGLAILATAGVIWWLSTLDFRVGELNNLLAEDPQLAAYPYTFRVISLENGVARMSSPRSARMSAIRGLRVMFPALVDASVDSEQMTAAQKELARLQFHAAQLISEQDDVKRVLWELDTRWLGSHGIYIQ
ncbi:MAG: hypothetical protein KDI01_00240 [Halioglobus sp.]|nr:hypothetical protein [Halioglobus sp.]